MPANPKLNQKQASEKSVGENDASKPKGTPTSPTKPKSVGGTPIKETTSQVHAPVDKPEVVMTDVTQKLEIHHVFGYRAKERRNNLFYLPTALNATDNDLVVYCAGSVGIIHQKSSNQQVILKGHDDDVLGIAIHPQSRLVATGQVGRDAFINIYKIQDTKFGKVPEYQKLKTLKVPRGSNGINGVAFNKDGDTVYAFTRGDPNNEVLVYDWQQEKLLTSTRVSNKILDLISSPFKKNEFLLVGVKYIAFAQFLNGKLELKRGEFGNNDLIQALPCGVYYNEDTILTGTAKGEIYTWRSQKMVKKSDVLVNGNILSLKKHDQHVLVGGKEGKVLLVDQEIKVVETLQIQKDQADDQESPMICSLDISGDKKQFKLLVGQRNCNIMECDISDNKFNGAKQTKLVNAHDTAKDAELWGLDIKNNMAVTCGDDGCIKVWNVVDRKCVVKIKVGPARAVCWHPKLNKIACGLRNGQVYVFEGDDKCLNWTQMNKFTVSNRDVTLIKYGPNGKYLITGAADGKIDVYDASNNHTRMGEMSGHTSRIIALDWNTEGNFLITNSTDKEVLYWDVEQMKQLTHLDTIKQLKWATYSCMFSWSTMGIWQQNQKVHDASDINCVDSSVSKKLLVDGTDTSLVQLWNWPRPKSKTPARNSL